MCYDHPSYARSLEEFGRPTPLTRCGGHVLLRDLPGTGWRDAMGCYPIFSCHDWSRLGEDIETLAEDAVSLTLVSDPFCPLAGAELAAMFDVCRPFKEHFVVDLELAGGEVADRHHRRYLRRALRSMEVVVAGHPAEHLGTWCELYAVLVERHAIRGVQAFSERAFAAQLEVPGTLLLLALRGAEVLGAQIWYPRGEVAYNHLVAVSPAGYELRASFALYGEAMRLIPERAPGVRHLDLGAGPGGSVDADDGLSRFKRGWSNGTRPVHLCGKVLQPEPYERLVAERLQGRTTKYFPAYRDGELTASASPSPKPRALESTT